MEKTKILVVDDEAGARELLSGFLRNKNYDVTEADSGEKALELYHDIFAPLALVDIKMPGMSGIELLSKLKDINPYIQVLVLTAFGSVEAAVNAMKSGAFDFITKPVEDLEELLVRLQKAVDQNRLIVNNQIMEERLSEVFPESEIIGKSPAIIKVKELISIVGKQEATVLVTGPSGTGKELVARAIHSLSDRSNNSLVAINCAAFPETLLESELFGYEKGAFTGADKTKQGRFELADNGTLFLDEIGEMPLSMQVKMLRVLEERKIQRLGSIKEISINVRIIAATNRDLNKMISEGSFREDLFYRLNVIQVDLPALKDREGDILLLAEKFIEKYTRKIGKKVKGLSSDAASLLTSYNWPGNVRELENVIERAIVLSQSDSINAADLSGLNGKTEKVSSNTVRTLQEIEKEAILNCLDQEKWNLTNSSEKLGIHRNTLRAKIKEYKLSKPS